MWDAGLQVHSPDTAEGSIILLFLVISFCSTRFLFARLDDTAFSGRICVGVTEAAEEG